MYRRRVMDARVRYTKHIIRTTFLSLLKEYPVNKITVTMICKQAEINRATFYKYFDNPYDCLAKIEEELLEEMQDKIIKSRSREFASVFKIILDLLKAHADDYCILFSQNGDQVFKERVFGLCYHENMDLIASRFENLSPKEQEWLYDFILEGCNGILNRWISHGMQDPVSEIFQFTYKLVNLIHEELPNK